MIRILFLCSGGGGNLKFINECIRAGSIEECEINGVVADRPCGAIEYARESAIPTYQIAYSLNDNAELKKILGSLQPDFVITNMHKILDKEIVSAFKRKLINLHYSLLPAFRGTIGSKPVRQALDQGCRVIGTTVHYAEEEVDAGTIISQSAFQVPYGTPFADIMNKVFRSGCINLLNGLVIASKGRVLISLKSATSVVLGDSTLFSPNLSFDPQTFDERFWSLLNE
ncbi:MAG: phosphoribosylglycinamide formyltransferase [Candidatus Aquicultorales bacterium]